METYWPYWLNPKEETVPSSWSASVWELLAVSCVTPVSPVTFVGALRCVVSPRPSLVARVRCRCQQRESRWGYLRAAAAMETYWPLVLAPKDETVPSPWSASEWEPAASCVTLVSPGTFVGAMRCVVSPRPSLLARVRCRCQQSESRRDLRAAAAMETYWPLLLAPKAETVPSS